MLNTETTYVNHRIIMDKPDNDGAAGLWLLAICVIVGVLVCGGFYWRNERRERKQ